MTKQHRDEFQRGRESLHGEMEMLRQINSDLLAALEAFLDPATNGDEGLYTNSREMARAAILKAKGE